MELLAFLPRYLVWHYNQGVRDLIGNLENILKFVFNLFSINMLFRTLFAPWERMDESYRKGIDINAWAETFVTNSVLRVLGFCIRTVTIGAGLGAFVITFILAVVFFALWLFMPLVLLMLLVIAGIKII